MTAEEITELDKLLYYRETRSMSLNEHNRMQTLLHKTLWILKEHAQKTK